MNQQLQRGGESAYIVTFSLCSLATTTTYRRGDLTTLNMCHRTLRFYDILVTILGGGVFTHLDMLRCVPTLGKLSNIY